MQRNLVANAVGDGVNRAEGPLILVVVIRRGGAQRLILIANHVVAPEHAPVEQIGAWHPNRLEKASIEGAASIGSPLKQTLLVRAVSVNQVQMKRRDEWPEPDIGFHPVAGRRLQMTAAPRNGCAAAGQEL